LTLTQSSLIPVPYSLIGETFASWEDASAFVKGVASAVKGES